MALQRRKTPEKISLGFGRKKIGASEDLPSLEIASDSAPNATWLPQIMKDTGLAKGSGEAIRLIKQGGVKVNDATVADPDIRLQQGEHIIKVGKRRFTRYNKVGT